MTDLRVAEVKYPEEGPKAARAESEAARATALEAEVARLRGLAQ